MTTRTYTYELGDIIVDKALVAQMRLRTGDTNVTVTGEDALFSDEEYMIIYNHEASSAQSDGLEITANNLLLLACAHAYEIIASNTALYVGKNSFLNNFTDGPAVSVELHRIADNWRAQAINWVI